MHSGPDSNSNTEPNLPAVADVNTSTKILIDPKSHFSSITTTENKITVAITLDKDTVINGVKTTYDNLTNAAIEFVKNPGPSISAGVGLSAGAKAGVEIAKSINHPVGKTAAVVGTAVLTSAGGVAVAETAKAVINAQVEQSAFNHPSAEDRAPSPTNDPSTMFSPLDDNNG